MIASDEPRLPPALRLSGTLFSMAFGYALLSVCLFRLLSFTVSSTAFFVLYVAAAMPVGAYLAQRLSTNWSNALATAVRTLLCAAILLPLLGWLATRGPAFTDAAATPFSQIGFSFFWRRLAYQLLIVSPFFIAWGFAEFVGFQAALRSGSRAVQVGFYLIFVWALACAVAVGFWSIPRWGVLRTVALVPLAAVLADDLRREASKRWLSRLVRYGAPVLIWLAAGSFEPSFVRHLFVASPYNVGDVLTNHRLPWGTTASGEVRVLESAWGKYTHLTLVEYKEGSRSYAVGAYDGLIHWIVGPAENAPYDLDALVYDFVPKKADVAILGAGGGRQVGQALATDPNHIVAVDLVQEAFSLFKGPHAQANGGVYLSPIVETVAADGRSYLQQTPQRFDFILLPNTESWGAIVRALFEPGQRIHTVEAFRAFRSSLKPDGVLAIVKQLDANERLFHSYAASLREAGFHVVGWNLPKKGVPGEPFVLLATPTERQLTPSIRAGKYLFQNGFHFVDFQKTAPTEAAIYDDSPWTRGVLSLMVSPEELTQMFRGIAVIAVVGFVGLLGLSVRRRELGESVLNRLLFVLAGVSVGIHAVYLQNAVIFWLLFNLFNPLASFFVGTALFLIAWGLSSILTRQWYLLLAIGVAGVFGMFLTTDWHGYGSLASMACVALGSGLCFALLGLRFQSRLLNLFVSDAVGGFAGGLLGIWLPVLFGFASFFRLLPWVSLSTLVLVSLTVVVSAREAAASESGHARSRFASAAGVVALCVLGAVVAFVSWSRLSHVNGVTTNPATSESASAEGNDHGQGFGRIVFGPAGGNPVLKQVEGPQGEQVRCQREDLPCSFLDLKKLQESGAEIPPDLRITRQELGTLNTQLETLSAFLSSFKSMDQVCEGGYFQTSTQFPNMGIHMANPDYMMDSLFDPAKPEMLLVARKDGDGVPWSKVGNCVNKKWTGDPRLQVVGAAFVLPFELVGEHDPEGFAGTFDNWHIHYNTCEGKEAIGTLSKEECASYDGRFVEKAGWMLHAYAMPGFDNQAGVFSMWNPTIWPTTDIAALEASRGEHHHAPPAAESQPAADPHAGHDMSAMAGHDMSGQMNHDMPAPATPAVRDSLIFDMKFTNMTISAGETVAFRNVDSTFHSVTAGAPGAPAGTFDSGDLFADQMFQFKFDSPGEYEFFCKRHPEMRGKIVVR